jgi:hypothetical protein
MAAAEAPTAAARRAFLQGAAVLLLAPGHSSFAQTPKDYRVGVLTAGTASAERARFDDFTRGLDELGYREGRNVQLERRYADGNFDRRIECLSPPNQTYGAPGRSRGTRSR